MQLAPFAVSVRQIIGARTINDQGAYLCDDGVPGCDHSRALDPPSFAEVQVLTMMVAPASLSQLAEVTRGLRLAEVGGSVAMSDSGRGLSPGNHRFSLFNANRASHGKYER